MQFSFGSTPAPASASTGGLFGAPTPTAGAPASGFSFGASTAPTTAAFGAAKPPAPGQSMFGMGSSSAFASAPAASSGFAFGQQTQQQQPQTGSFGAVGAAAPGPQEASSASAKEFEKLATAYREKLPGSNQPNPGCRMKHVVYNQVDPGQRNNYVRPQHMDEKAWKKAEEDNPDPSNLVPAAMIGWQDMKERLLMQQQEIVKMAKFVATMQSTASNGLRSGALVRTRMEASRRRHMAQAHRFLKIQRKLDIVRCMTKPLHEAERQLRMRLENVHRSLGPPQQTLKDVNSSLLQGERQTEEVEEITDPEKLRRIFEALEGQRDGLQHLMRIVKKDKQDLEIMMKPRAITQQ